MNSVFPGLLNAAVISAPVTVAVWLALRVTPRHALNAATRYVIWWIALIVVSAMPILFFPLHVAHPVATTAAPIAVQVLEIESTAASVPVSGFHLPVAIPSGAWMRWFLAAWMSLSTALLLRLLLSYRAIRHAVDRASEVPADLRQRLRPHRRAFRIAASDVVRVPVAVGPIRPAILLPSALLSQMTADDIEPLILHEAAHLARRDDWALFLERLVEAVFCLHPVVRWITRQIDLEREIACDDLVVEATSQPCHYATSLTRAMALCGPGRRTLAAVGATGRRRPLSKRVELLLDRARATQTGILPARLTVFAVALAVAAAALASLPAPLTFTPKSAPKLTPPFKETSMKSRTAQKLVLAAVAAAAVTPKPSPTQSARQPVDDRSAPAQPAEKRLLALYFDTTTLTAADRDQAVLAATKFVQAQVNPGDVVAVMASTANGVQVLQDFTADSGVLLSAIQNISLLPAGGIATQLPSDPAATEENDRRLAHLQTVARTLGVLPERKILVFFAAGMTRTVTANQAQLQATVNTAIQANVAIYPMDAQGLATR